ncbi:MAG: molybdopterin-dependent oxidoreductase, partial [Gemmatimonadota bacterium]|nr:molybdopterin-dependent oxidoreductase [Gemmatimonadota bacterium]
MTAVGRNVTRKDGAAKTSGAALYIDDLTFPGMLHGMTVRSTVPCGRIRGIAPTFDDAGFTIVRASDIPGRNVIALIEDDQPCLAERDVSHMAEPIMLVAHESRDALIGVRFEIDYERTEPVFDPLASTKVLKSLNITKGDVDAAMAGAELVVEGEYRTGHQEHVYIENNGVIAVPENGGVTIYGSLQCPFYVQKAMRVLLALPDE